MQQEATLLQNRMKSVQQDVQKVEQETAQAMESLLKIDTAKSRMHSVEKALRVNGLRKCTLHKRLTSELTTFLMTWGQ